MKYYKQNTIPLEEVQLGIGEKGFDEYGNYIEINMFQEPVIIKESVLNDKEKINEYLNENFLKVFWTLTDKHLKVYEVHDTA